jgi:putative ABC transport system permease protein
MSVMSWLARVLRGRQADADLREEMETHRALMQSRLERGGMSADEAAPASRRAFGNAALARDDARDVWVIRWLDAIRQDVRHAVRILVKHRGVTAAAIVSLAIGIGANTAVFSLVDSVLLKPLPYAEPDRLVIIYATAPGRPQERARATVPEYMAWQAHATSFEGMTTAFQGALTLGADDSGAPAESVLTEKVRATLFDVLGVRPAIGRAFRADEEKVDAPAPVAILSDEFWTRRYARNPAIVGSTIKINNIPLTVVGVMPPQFAFLPNGRTDVFLPLSWNSPQLRGTGRVFSVVARLKPGVELAQAQAELNTLSAQLEPTLPAPSKGWRTQLQPLDAAFKGDLRLPLMMLQSIVGFVLLIACGNVAGLLLARASGRSTEMALRSAIGAGRRRLVRQLLTESVVLAVAGGAAGAAVGWMLSRALIAVSTTFIPSMPAATFDVRVLTFTLAVSVVTGLVFGLLPALSASRGNLVEQLKPSAKGTSGAAARHGLRTGVVVAQIALACVLLVGAGLSLRSFVSLVSSDLGGDPQGVVRVDFLMRGLFRQVGSANGFPLVEVSPKVDQTIAQVLERLHAVPGVQAAAGASLPPFTGSGPDIGFSIAGRPTPTTAEQRAAMTAAFQVVTRGFFGVMRIPMDRGREFDARDSSGSPWGVVVNRAMADRFWPGADPIGERILLDMTADEQPREIVGVVTNYRESPYTDTTDPAMFVLHDQQPLNTRGPIGMVMRNRMNFVVRGAGDAAALSGSVRAAMATMDRDQPAPTTRPVQEDLRLFVAPSRYITLVCVLFAGVAILLAAVGIYGVMSHGVSVRTREIGLRMAIGADPRDVMQLIMRRVVVLTAIGLAIGLAGAALLARLLSRAMGQLLVGVAPFDLVTYAAVTVVMAAVALLAGWIPTRRAIRVAPTVALRCE